MSAQSLKKNLGVSLAQWSAGQLLDFKFSGLNLAGEAPLEIEKNQTQFFSPVSIIDDVLCPRNGKDWLFKLRTNINMIGPTIT